MIVFRHADPRFAFLWEGDGQPASRWQPGGGEPVHCFADTPDGAWAELLRHEEITDPADLAGIRRALWAVEIGEPPGQRATLGHRTLTGGPSTYPACRREARRLGAAGHHGLVGPSAALLPGAAGGWRVQGGLRPGPGRDARVVVLFGARQDVTGWAAALPGRPGEDLLEKVRHYARG